MKRIISILTIASAIICGLLLVLLPLSDDFYLNNFDAKPGQSRSQGSIVLISDIRCGVSGRGVWFFNGDVPYTGSVMHAGDEGGIYYEGGRARTIRHWSWNVGEFGSLQKTFIGENGEFVGRDRFADLPGIYYCHFEWWTQERPWWTLRVSLWYPILLFAILPGLWAIRCVYRSFKPKPAKTAAPPPQ